MRYTVHAVRDADPSEDSRRGVFLRVKGLKDNVGKDKLLISVNDYGEPSTRFKNADEVHSALYDLYQVNDDLKEGDEFETPFGVFYCRSFHVLNEEERARWDASHA